MLEIQKRSLGAEQGEKLGKNKKERMTFSCPIYGKSVGEPRLSDVQSIVIEGWYFVQKTRIVSSKVIFEHEFVYYHDGEEDIGLEKLHTAIAVISAEFNGKGNCTVFDILEICPCDIKDSMKEEKLMEVEDG